MLALGIAVLDRPVGAERDVFKYYCPICMLYFKGERLLRMSYLKRVLHGKRFTSRRAVDTTSAFHV
jgi:hypothetical protein